MQVPDRTVVRLPAPQPYRAVRQEFGQHLIRRFAGLASVTWIGITIQVSTVFGFVPTAEHAVPGVL